MDLHEPLKPSLLLLRSMVALQAAIRRSIFIAAAPSEVLRILSPIRPCVHRSMAIFIPVDKHGIVYFQGACWGGKNVAVRSQSKEDSTCLDDSSIHLPLDPHWHQILPDN